MTHPGERAPLMEARRMPGGFVAFREWDGRFWTDWTVVADPHHHTPPEASSEQHDLDVEVLELRETVDELRKELAGYKRWASSVNEALNTGDGSYRP